jgi:NAD(P)H-hydrate epimerase
LVGPGNNGGDGLVTGRHLAAEGGDIKFYMYRPRDPGQDHNLAKVINLGLPVTLFSDDEGGQSLQDLIAKADIVVDSLLGTGVTRPVEGNLARMMGLVRAALEERTNMEAGKARSRLVSPAQFDDPPDIEPPQKSTRPAVVAVDCPSGMNCDSGVLDPLAVPADLTVTFAGPKRGHFIYPGADACGELVVADIDISSELPEVQAVKVECASAEAMSDLLPVRSSQGHKGTFGWVLIAAGSSRYWGAPALAGRGAYRTGSGLVAIASPKSIVPSLAVQLPEATYPAISDEFTLGKAAADEIMEIVELYDAMLVGPGLHNAKSFMLKLLQNKNHLPPLVIDADGLNILAAEASWPNLLPSQTILTPHLGEMARLRGISVVDAKDLDRVEMAQNAAEEWDSVVLLKGAYTVVAAPDANCAIIPFANPALATAGSGDVLSGIIVSLLGQGLAPYHAAVLGAYLHGAAAQLTLVDAGLLASEIADWVPEVRQALARGPV